MPTTTTTNPNPTDLLTPTAVAETLGLPADTVRGWVRGCGSQLAMLNKTNATRPKGTKINNECCI